MLARKQQSATRSRFHCPRFEQLESRTLLSASQPVAIAAPQIIPVAGIVGVAVPNLDVLPAAAGGSNAHSPAQIRHAYGFDQLSLSGAGQTIAIVDAYSDPTIGADLHKFDQAYGLADPSLALVQQITGGVGPAYNASWA